MTPKTRTAALIAARACALAPPAAHAQLAGGNIYGQVVDESGAKIPGAQVELTGARTGARSTVSGSDGAFRFLNLDPGTHKVAVALSGFTKHARELVVSTGSIVDVAFKLTLAGLEESVTVSAQTPVIDRKRAGTATNFTQDELTKIPNSRDPWALLRTVPGIVLDRVNIAGNESGQQSNFVTKRGGNSLHGTARGFFTHDALEWSNVPGELRALGVTQATADHNEQIADYGVDVGGPILRDKLWFWAAYAKQDIRLARSAGTLIDKTLLIDYNTKLNWQATSKRRRRPGGFQVAAS